ncbi:MAG: asparagine--tRNA ligase [Candidatus Magasanikbacteria bacterium CG_4_10_14_0_2_um_filter_37_12]|uniref:Asparagine--tRNA ligase n=1 Tax=Candidatus Magasanikbacteria bacterium CG_4_10_14_0_2_um_filter_37_12 TaxID=1974637 RepID=A0A2M7V8R5_9BACT|nr:MAG: asparagine--tRNA ligase [Candidatus Magasanikbacteria bacterium CG_4_10_14_0_2_um_filter_37_12]
MQTLIKDIAEYVGQEITLKGWLYNKRSSGKIAFLEIRDGSGFIQAIVLKSAVSEEIWQQVEGTTQESSVVVTGNVSAHPKEPGVFELQVTDYQLLQKAEEYPITKKEHGPEFLLDNRHLWLRSKKQWAVLRLRHLVKVGFQDYFNSNGYLELDTPTFTPTACEGTTDLFEVDYFGRPAYLTQNGQLYLEAMCMSFGKVYDLCPNFRAEKSKTRKHLTEFWTLNPEIAYVEHEESLAIQEASIKHMVAYALAHGQEELTILERDTADLQAVVDGSFVHYEYGDAIAELQKLGSAIQYGDDLGAEDEVLLTENSLVPVIVKNWPKSIKPFYMKTHPDNQELVCNADVLAPKGFGEIIGGSQREDDYQTMLDSISKHGLPVADFEWYLDLRRYGSVPHCGFGIGIERMTRWMAGIHHIRETIPFPRMLNRVSP